MGQVFIQGQGIAAMTEHTAKGGGGMRGADFFDAVVTGEAQFRLIGQRGREGFGRGQGRLPG